MKNKGLSLDDAIARILLTNKLNSYTVNHGIKLFDIYLALKIIPEEEHEEAFEVFEVAKEDQERLHNTFKSVAIIERDLYLHKIADIVRLHLESTPQEICSKFGITPDEFVYINTIYDNCQQLGSRKGKIYVKKVDKNPNSAV